MNPDLRKFQIFLIGLTGPVPTNLDEFSRHACLKGPRSPSPAERMPSETMGVRSSRTLDELPESVDENGLGKPLDLAMLEKNEGRGGSVGREEGGGRQERCYRAEWRRGREERNV